MGTEIRAGLPDLGFGFQEPSSISRLSFELLSRGSLSLNPLLELCRRKPGRLSSFQRPASLGLHSLSHPQHLSHAPHDVGWLIDDLLGQLLEFIAKVWVDLQVLLFRVGQDGLIFDSLLECLA